MYFPDPVEHSSLTSSRHLYGGLGLGSAVLGKQADRSPNPMRLYGILESLIALSAALSPWLIALTSSLYFRMGGQETLGFAGATIVHLVFATAVMGAPAILMGGTLPAAVRAYMPIGDAHRRALGLLYGAKTAGGVVGVAAATFFALKHLGTRATLFGGCAISLFVGVVAIVRSRNIASVTNERSGHSSPNQESQSPTADNSEYSGAREALICVTACVLGFTFFALELVWYRILAPILGGTAFTFGLILCVWR
jgi:spermidine synthase